MQTFGGESSRVGTQHDVTDFVAAEINDDIFDFAEFFALGVFDSEPDEFAGFIDFLGLAHAALSGQSDRGLTAGLTALALLLRAGSALSVGILGLRSQQTGGCQSTDSEERGAF